jgi:hypothetical protein
MTNLLLPSRIDNDYRGQKLALWLFAPLMLVKTIIGLNSIFNGAMVAGSADGIPLTTYGAAGAQAVVSLFALLGLANLMVPAISILALLRYRAMVPLLFALMLAQSLCGKLILQFLPLNSNPSPADILGLIFPAVMVAGLALSLWPRKS